MFLPVGDQAGIERLIQYMTRCPFSLSGLVKVSDTGQIVYQAEKQACRAFPDPKGDGTRAGVKRNVMDLWLAEGEGLRPLVVYIHGGGWLASDKKLIPAKDVRRFLKRKIGRKKSIRIWLTL